MLKSVIIAALGLLPVYRDDRGLDESIKRAQLAAIAAAVHKAAPDAETAAFVIAWGSHETNYALRTTLGFCLGYECDPGRVKDGVIARARSPWQIHRGGMSLADWDRMAGFENLEFQARKAVKMSRWALSTCRTRGDERILGAFRVLGGRGCAYPIRGEQARLATFKKLRGIL
jgi:hypothetical protein